MILDKFERFINLIHLSSANSSYQIYFSYDIEFLHPKPLALFIRFLKAMIKSWIQTQIMYLR